MEERKRPRKILKKQDPNDDKAEQERKNAIFKKAAQTEYKMLGELSKHATDNLLMLRKEENPENKMKYAQAITDICNNLDSKRFNFEDYKIDKISEEQKKVQDAINEYAQMLWHYTLVMENISYLAAGEQDFSMLSETFVNFALITQQKEQQAAKLLEELK